MDKAVYMRLKMLLFFENRTDSRIEHTNLHCLKDIISITICAALCGCDGRDEIELKGQKKQEWLRQFLQLSNEIPTQDIFKRVFAMLNVQELRACFLSWVHSVAEITDCRAVSIDE
ncbi:MAG TPA: ISAs1 family transposase [Arachidicoccus soli]|nr:ISAs1 family transposase [Arachidicoccus soli]